MTTLVWSSKDQDFSSIQIFDNIYNPIYAHSCKLIDKIVLSQKSRKYQKQGNFLSFTKNNKKFNVRFKGIHK